MKREIHILYLEDDPADALRFDAVLAKSGLNFRSQRVETREAFMIALEQPLDVILSDHGLPTFDGLAALDMAHEKCPEVPFIFVTNALSAEMEIEKLTGAVADFVAKSRLEDLPTAVAHALLMAEDRRLHKICSEVLSKSGLWRSNLPICSNCKKIRDEHNEWKPLEVFFRDQLKIKFTHSLCPECMPKFVPEK